MDDYLRNYLVALPVFVVIDFLWLGIVSKRFYLKELGTLARVEDGKFRPNLPAALIAWALIPAGLVIFAVPRLAPEGSVLDAAGWGALFGAISYGIYDFTNLATVKGYSLRLAIVDTAWGAILSALVTTVVWLIAK